MIKLVNKYKYFLFLAVVFLLFRLPSLFEPYWYGDEGIYLVLGQGIRKGLTLYTQIHDNKPPTLYYLAAIGQTVFGFRLLLMGFMALTVFFFYKLSLLFLSIKKTKIATVIFLVLSSIPLIEGHIANAEVFMLLPTILGFYLFFKTKNKLNLFLSSLLLGLAFTIKVPVLIEFLFLFLWLFIGDFKSIKKMFSQIPRAFIFGLGFILPIFLWSVYFYFQGAFKPFIVASLLQNFGYLSSWSTGTQTASVGSGGLFTRFLLVIFAWIFVYFLKIIKKIDSKFCFILFWFIATIFGALLSTRPYPHYLIQTLPPLILVILSFFEFKKILKPLLSIISIFCFVFVVAKYKFYFYPVVSYYQNFYSYALKQKSQSDYFNYFGSQVNSVHQISKYIKENSSALDKIFVWGDEPYIYALSDRLPTSKYTVAYHILDFNGYDQTINQIKSTLPKFVVYVPMTNRPFEDLDHILKRYYYVKQIFGNFLLYQIR